MKIMFIVVSLLSIGFLCGIYNAVLGAWLCPIAFIVAGLSHILIEKYLNIKPNYEKELL